MKLIENYEYERDRQRECKSVIWGEKELDVCD